MLFLCKHFEEELRRIQKKMSDTSLKFKDSSLNLKIKIIVIYNPLINYH